MKLLEYILYINLEHRNDRNQHFLEQIHSLNRIIEQKQLGKPIVPERFNAVQHPTHGAIGCSTSHTNCLSLAKERKLPYVCIMEDDIVFSDPKEILEKLQIFEQTFQPNEWDVLLIGGNVMSSEPISQTDCCNRLLNAQVAVGYIVQQHYYDTLLHNFNEGLRHLTNQPTRKTRFAIDMYWKSLQRKDKWFVIKPLMINQLPCYSDIEKRQVNYNHSMIKKMP